MAAHLRLVVSCDHAADTPGDGALVHISTPGLLLVRPSESLGVQLRGVLGLWAGFLAPVGLKVSGSVGAAALAALPAPELPEATPRPHLHAV